MAHSAGDKSPSLGGPARATALQPCPCHSSALALAPASCATSPCPHRGQSLACADLEHLRVLRLKLWAELCPAHIHIPVQLSSSQVLKIYLWYQVFFCATLLHSFLNNPCISISLDPSLPPSQQPMVAVTRRKGWPALPYLCTPLCLVWLWNTVCMLPTQLCLVSSQTYSCQKPPFSPTQVPGCATGMCPGLCFNVIYMKSTVLAENEPSGTRIFFSFSTINEGKTSCF